MASAVLDAALNYHDLGWSIIPVEPASKKAAKTWKRWQRERPDHDQLKRWFDNDKGLGLAVVMGESSGGLTCRDFDDMPAYEQWAGSHPQLASSLPTVRTSRGRHVYFLSTYRKCEKVSGGELRGAKCYCVLPPSKHESGHEYAWEREPFGVELPSVNVFDSGFLYEPHTKHIDFVTQSTQRNPETQAVEVSECEGVTKPLPPKLVVCSFKNESELEQAIEIAILTTLPVCRGQRNRQVFEFARALKGISSLADKTALELKPYVRQWHSAALQFNVTPQFSFTWGDFATAWPQVKYAKGGEPVYSLLKQAFNSPYPVEAFEYDAPEAQRLVVVCKTLQEISGEGNPFYLSARWAGAQIGTNHVQAWRFLNAMQADGLVMKVKSGELKGRQASVFLYRPNKPR